MSYPTPSIQKQFSSRITEAREATKLSQDEAATILNIARSILSEMETGKRPITIADLEKFSSIYRRDISYFLREQKEESVFAVLLRASKNDEEAQSALSKFETHCYNFDKLHELLKIESRERPYQSDLPFDSSRSKSDWIEHYCKEVRNFLEVGNSPVLNLRDLLEDKLDIKVFYLPINEAISGVFTYTQKLGGCILINQKHSPGRQLFSLAHEFAHFLFDKKRLGLISWTQNKNEQENIADAFAEEFLMPSSAVKNSFYERIKDEVVEEDVLFLADTYGVSFKAMAIRLRKLRLIKTSEANRFIEETWVNSLRAMVGLKERSADESLLPKGFRHLAIKAFRKNLMSVSALSEFLDSDLWSTKKLALEIPESV